MIFLNSINGSGTRFTMNLLRSMDFEIVEFGNYRIGESLSFNDFLYDYNDGIFSDEEFVAFFRQVARCQKVHRKKDPDVDIVFHPYRRTFRGPICSRRIGQMMKITDPISVVLFSHIYSEDYIGPNKISINLIRTNQFKTVIPVRNPIQILAGMLIRYRDSPAGAEKTESIFWDLTKRDEFGHRYLIENGNKPTFFLFPVDLYVSERRRFRLVRDLAQFIEAKISSKTLNQIKFWRKVGGSYPGKNNGIWVDSGIELRHRIEAGKSVRKIDNRIDRVLDRWKAIPGFVEFYRDLGYDLQL